MTMNVDEVFLHNATASRYLNYALSVITSRALPDVRDGLKPVQRRILYAMYHNLRLAPDSRHRKSAAVVGEVMAKYHPHGDQSIYDAMVRMAQDFSLRYPLVDGQGNFGSLDGDGAAAMRYTEARLRHLAVELISEIQKKTIDYRVNYDGTIFEPIVLPAQVPNLLVNGTTGIAVGMATNIPPHNLKEVVGALIALVDEPELPIEKIVGKYIKAPDFPTGGAILNTRQELTELYTTGRGGIDVRAEYTVEQEGRTKQVIIKSIPYGVNKATLVGDIADHVIKGKLPQVLDVRDESTEEIRIVLEIHRKANPEAAMAYLFKRTSLQSRFNMNLTALIPTSDPEVCRPKRLSLLEVLRHFLDFRYEVTERRLNYDLAELERRIHLLKAFEIIFNALDEAIALIRSSEGKADAREKLMDRFELDHEQAEAILETKLYRLAKLEINAIREELEEKELRAAELRDLLGSKEKMWALIRQELSDIRAAYGDRRRSKVTGPKELESFSEELYIVKEDCFVIVTREGWCKRQKSYTELAAIRIREGDELGWVSGSSTRETLILFTNLGKAYTIRVADLPATTGYGEAIQTKLDFTDGEYIVGATTTDPRVLPPPPQTSALPEESADSSGDSDGESTETETLVQQLPNIVAITRGGKTLRLALDAFKEVSTVNGRKFMRLDKAVKNDAVVDVFVTTGAEYVSMATRKGKCLIFHIGEINVLSGAGKGVMAIKLDTDDFVVGFALATGRMEGLEVETNRGRVEVVRFNKYVPTKRGNRGRDLIKKGHISKVRRNCLENRFPLSESKEEGIEEVEEEQELNPENNTLERTEPPNEENAEPDSTSAEAEEEDDSQGELF